jgi:DNA repair exonuclease SbcCD ATPase subunit
MAESSVIETGVDKLVALVKQNRRISVPDAAKKLNVSKVVVEEWADFLEEEGIINIEYNFTTPYLVERQMSKKEVDEKVKEFKGKKEGFVRKAEVCLSLLDNNGDAFANIKEEFKSLKDELGKDLKGVQEELNLLEQYNREKRDIDGQVKETEKAFKDKIAQMESQIEKEKQRYADIVTDIKVQQKVLNDEKIKAMSMNQMITAAEASIDKYDKMASEIKKRLADEQNLISNVQKHIDRLSEVAESQRSGVDEKNKQMDDLIRKSSEAKKKIADLEQNILKKVIEKSKAISRGKDANKAITVKFKKFLAQNSRVEVYMNKVLQDRAHLKEELQDLIKKANTINLISKNQDIKNYLPELQKKFEQIEKDKGAFEKEVGILKKLIKI